MSDTRQYGGTRPVPLGELNKGIVRNVPPTSIPAGGFFDLDGYISTERGLRRRSAVEDYVRGASITASEHMVAIEGVGIPGSSGMARYLFTESWCYQVSTTAFTSFWRKEATGTVTIGAGSANVQGNSTVFVTNLIKVGDVLVVEPGTGSEEQRTINSVVADAGAGALTVSAVFTNAHTTKAYEIRRTVGVAKPYLVDICRLPDRILVHSRANEPWVIDYNDTVIREAITSYPSTGKFKAACGCFWNERHFVGNLIDGTDGEKQARIRWSEAGTITDFSLATAFLDMDYTKSPLLRLVPLGSMLLAFFADAVFIGRPTNNPLLPVAFTEKLNTGGIGLLGQLALSEYVEGIFFAGQDNIYKVTNSGFAPAADAVAVEMMRGVTSTWRTMLVTDLLESRLLVGMQRDADVMEKLWSLDLRKGGWSKRTVSTYMLASIWFTQVEDWATLTSFWDVYTVDWSSFSGQDNRKYVLIERAGTLNKIGAGSGSLDNDDTAIATSLESGDINYGMPETKKTTRRLSVGISEEAGRAVPITMQMSVSPNAGVTWISKGTLTIRVGFREGYINFRSKSSIFRFRLTSDSQVPSYTIEEINLRTKAGGEELSLREQSDV